MKDKKFSLDKRDGKFLGVCKGISNYTGVDVTLVRILTAVFSFYYGVAIVIYFVTAFVAPKKEEVQESEEADFFDKKDETQL